MSAQKKGRSCPRCGGTDIQLQEEIAPGVLLYVCVDCDHEFEVKNRSKVTRDVQVENRDEWENPSYEDEESEEFN
jgi:DNA-directed RNA polymerase subunit M/transcription elongation factor TFIIS